jgi:hypothetical protein
MSETTWLATIAGTGIAGHSGDGFNPRQAQINTSGLSSLAYSNGCLYFSEPAHHCIRKIDLQNQVISRVAGIVDSAGFSGDSGLATNAQLNSPSGIGFDGDGNLYVSDTQNHVIRKIDVLGIITTVAGNGIQGEPIHGVLAINTMLNLPKGISVAQVNLGAGLIWVVFFLCEGGKLRYLNLSNGSICSEFYDQGINLSYIGNSGLASSTGYLHAYYKPKLYPADDNQTVIIIPSNDGITRYWNMWLDRGRFTGDIIQHYPNYYGATSIFGINLISVHKLNHFGTQNNKIFKFGNGTVWDTSVSYISGTGVAGFNGDGKALEKQINNPTDILLVDNQLFFIDSGNHLIRKVTTSFVWESPTITSQINLTNHKFQAVLNAQTQINAIQLQHAWLAGAQWAFKPVNATIQINGQFQAVLKSQHISNSLLISPITFKIPRVFQTISNTIRFGKHQWLVGTAVNLKTVKFSTKTSIGQSYISSSDIEVATSHIGFEEIETAVSHVGFDEIETAGLHVGVSEIETAGLHVGRLDRELNFSHIGNAPFCRLIENRYAIRFDVKETIEISVRNQASIKFSVESLNRSPVGFLKTLELLNKARFDVKETIEISLRNQAPVKFSVETLNRSPVGFLKTLELLNKARFDVKETIEISVRNQAFVKFSVESWNCSPVGFLKNIESLNKARFDVKETIEISLRNQAPVKFSVESLNRSPVGFLKTLESLNRSPVGFLKTIELLNKARFNVLNVTPISNRHIGRVRVGELETLILSNMMAWLETPTGQISLSDVTISTDLESGYWKSNITLQDYADFDRLKVDMDVTLHFPDESYVLYIQNLSRDRQESEVNIQITLASPAARLLNQKFSKTYPEISAQEAVNELANGYTIDWQIVEWNIKNGRLAITEAGRLETLKKIIAAPRGVLISKPDGSLLVTPEWKVPVKEWENTLTDHVFDTVFSIKETIQPIERWDSVEVFDVSGKERRFSHEYQANDKSKLNGKLKVHSYPWTYDVEITHTGFSSVGLGYVGEQIETIYNELVEFKMGKANTSKPILELLGIKWKKVNLGQLTFEIDNNELIAEEQGYSLAAITYQTRALVWNVGNAVADNVQFLILGNKYIGE